MAALSPLFLYWWGLSILDEPPVPSVARLTPERELMIWVKENGTGEPEVTPVTVYGYILYTSCHAQDGQHAAECMAKYTGLRLASLAVRNQVAEKVRGQGGAVLHVTWAAYSIWVTRNWDIHQILATYDEAYGT